MIEQTPEEWLLEINQALKAIGNVDKCSAAFLLSLVKKAPEAAALKHGIDDADIIDEMEAYAWKVLDKDLELGGDVEECFPIFYALSYFDGLRGGDFISEKDKDRIMDVICEDLYGL